MRGVNKVILVGNLGKDPEIRYTESQIPVANFTLATTESYKDKNGNRVDQTEWHNIVLWRGLADVANNYLHKGSQVYIEGRIKTRQWDDKDGNKRYTTEIVGDSMLMLDRKSDGNSAAAPAASQVAEPAPAQDMAADSGEDLPF